MNSIYKFFFVFVIFYLLINFHPIYAATITWDGEGTDNNWSSCDNWSSNTCPTTTSDVVFDTTSTKDSTLDGGFSSAILSLSINSGYTTGTVSLANSLHTTAAFSQADGFFTASNQTLDIDTAFTLSAGSFTASSGTTYIGGAITISGTPVFNANNGVITFDGSSATLSCNNVTFNSVTFGHVGAATKTISSNCTLPLGTSTTSFVYGRLTLAGTLQGTGIFHQYNRHTYNAGATLSGFSGYTTTKEVNIQGADLDFSSFTSFAGGTTRVFSGSLILPNVNVSNASNIEITGGSFTAGSGILSLGGNFVHTSGTFNHNNGTLKLTGTNQTLSGTTTFYNLTKTVTAASTLTFPASTTTTVLGTLTLNGTLNNLLSLISSSTDTQWSIDPQGTRDLQYLDVKDSNNSSSTVAVAYNSTNSNNNSLWSFLTVPSASSLTTSSATISWDTNQVSSSQVEYGLTSSYGSTTTISDTSPRVTSHTVVLSELVSSSTYHFRVRSIDSNSDEAISSDYTFTTSTPVANSDNSQSEENSIEIPYSPDGNIVSGAIIPIKDSNTGEQKVITMLEPLTFSFNGYLSAIKQSPTDLFSSDELLSTKQTNIVRIGGDVIGIEFDKRIYWQVGSIQKIYYKAYPPVNSGKDSAIIIPSLQRKPSIISLSYTDSSLIPAGDSTHPFNPSNLKLAHSIDGHVWTLLSSSVVDSYNHTVSAIDKVGGYYLVVGW